MLRFSFNPNRDLTIADLRVAIINYILSKQRNEGFALKIEDIGLLEKGLSEQENLDILKKFAIDTENTLYQSKNLNIYQTFALQLLREKRAFLCFCNSRGSECSCLDLTSKELEKFQRSRERFKVKIKESNKAIEFNDIVLGSVTANSISSFEILKDNSEPSSSFASAVDDVIMDISLIVKERKDITKTLEEAYIKEQLKINSNLEYAHIPEIVDRDGLRLEGEWASVKWLLRAGFLPDAIINYLLSLGYNPPKRIFYLPDAIEWFDIKKISKDSVEFNINELRELNREHLLKMDSKELSKIFKFADRDIGELLKIYLKELSTIIELDIKLKSIFSPKSLNIDDRELKEAMEILSKIIKDAPMIESFEEFKLYLKEKSNLEDKRLIEALSLLITGEERAPELKEIYPKIKPYLTEVTKCQF